MWVQRNRHQGKIARTGDGIWYDVVLMEPRSKVVGTD